MSNHHFHRSAGPGTILLLHFPSVPGSGFLHVGPPILHVRRTRAFSRSFFASRTAFFACRLTFLHVGQTYPCGLLADREQSGTQQQNKTNHETDLGGCQNHGPAMDPLNTRCRILVRTQKGTIILTTTHFDSKSQRNRTCSPRASMQ